MIVRAVLLCACTRKAPKQFVMKPFDAESQRGPMELCFLTCLEEFVNHRLS